MEILGRLGQLLSYSLSNPCHQTPKLHLDLLTVATGLKMDIIFFPTVCFCPNFCCNKAQSYVCLYGLILYVCCAVYVWVSVTVSSSYPIAFFCCVCLPLSVAQQVIPEGLLIFVWVQQHSIKLVKYAQGYLSQPERLWTYMSPSNRCTNYGLQLAPEEWPKHLVSQAQT